MYLERWLNMWIDYTRDPQGNVLYSVMTQGLKGEIVLANYLTFHEAANYIRLNSGVEIV